MLQVQQAACLVSREQQGLRTSSATYFWLAPKRPLEDYYAERTHVSLPLNKASPGVAYRCLLQVAGQQQLLLGLLGCAMLPHHKL